MDSIIHTPVMLKEVISYLSLKSGSIYVDATIGEGGHAESILETGARVIGIDQDEEVLEKAAKRLARFESQIRFIYGNFRNIKQLLYENGISKVDGILYDIGISSYQLDSKERGFSFKYNAPLDMRMDMRNSVKAVDLVNSLTTDKLIDIIRKYGEERRARQIANQIIRNRPIETTFELVSAITAGMPSFAWRAKIHPATRTFQALRIAVNNELSSLEESLEQAIEVLNKDARLVVISFHSLEDRIVKYKFREFKNQEKPYIEIITKKPLVPDIEEMQINPRARSAKLRAIKKL